MFKTLIQEIRALIEAEVTKEPGGDEPEGEVKNVKLNKHQRAAKVVGVILTSPKEDISRKKLLKSIPHMQHHFNKGMGKGDENGVVDAEDLSQLSQIAHDWSAHANGVNRMPGPHHLMTAHLHAHAARCHDKNGQAAFATGNHEAAQSHAEEGHKHEQAAKHHVKAAARHGYR